jgi:hypothetical protein
VVPRLVIGAFVVMEDFAFAWRDSFILHLQLLSCSSFDARQIVGIARLFARVIKGPFQVLGFRSLLYL